MLYVAHIHVYVTEHTNCNIALFDPNLQITYTVFTFTYTMLVKQTKYKMTLGTQKKFKTPKFTNTKIHQPNLHTQCIPTIQKSLHTACCPRPLSFCRACPVKSRRLLLFCQVTLPQGPQHTTNLLVWLMSWL